MEYSEYLPFWDKLTAQQRQSVSSVIEFRKVAKGTSSKENTKVYFRVANVYRNIKITVKAGDKILLEKKKEKVAPGEMETLILSEKLLDSCAPDATITFALEELK